MKTHKLTKIFGVGLSLILLVSMLAIAAPVSAADPGAQEWKGGSEPGSQQSVILNGSDVTDIAVSADGKVWLVDADKDLVKSTTSGVWSSIGNYNSTGDDPMRVAVAPDNSDCIAIVDEFDAIHISNDGGTTWSSLPALTGIYATPGVTVKDIAVGPARSGTLLGREYAVATADNATASTTGGDVLIIGQTATWTPVVTAVTSTADFVELAFSPNYAGDRILLAIGANAGGTSLYLMNASTNTQLTNSPVSIETTIIDWQSTDLTPAGAAIAPAATGIKGASIALASDFDPTDASAYRAWVSVTQNVPLADKDGVYRIDGSTATNLRHVGSTVAKGVDTVAYSGTNDAGTLFVGYTSVYTGGTMIVKRSSNPQSNVPTWVSTKTQPTGSTFALVAVAPDFGSTNKVYVGSTGNESAWNISEDGGVSFYQRSYIDNDAGSNVVHVEDMKITSDGATMWWATDDGADIHVWMTSVPPSSMGYKRMYSVMGNGSNAYVPAAASSDVRLGIYLNPDWATSPTVVVTDNSGATNNVLYVSHNAGATWTTMQGPGADDIDAFAMVDATTYYATIDNNFYKSTNAGWTWEDAVAFYSSGYAKNIVVTDSGKIFIGRSGGGVRLSTNGGASWASQGTGNPTNPVYVLPDVNYDVEGASGEGIIYSQNSVTGTFYSYDKNGDGLWVNLGGAVGNGQGIFQAENGVLYSVSTGNGTAFTCNRTINPRGSTVTWETMDQPAASLVTMTDNCTGPSDFALQGDVAWLMTTNANNNNNRYLYGYQDVAATATTTITAPVEGYVLPVDPNNGVGASLTITWDAVGSGQAKANAWDIQISDAALGWSSPALNDNAKATSSSSSPALMVYSGATAAAGISNATLNPNTTYQIRVRVDNQVSTDNIRSNWSEPVSFSVAAGGQVQSSQAGAEILGPAGGSTTTLTPGFSWTPVTGVTEYEFVLATDAALTNTVAGTPATVTSPAFSLDAALDYSTTYFWAVKPTQPTAGVQSIGTFTTMAEPTEAETGAETTPTIVVENGGDSTPAIPTAAVWAVIVIGAILVVAVLVLIVRTRRPL